MPLYHNLATNIVDTDYVLGWYPNALDLHPFKYLSFGEKSVRPNVARFIPRGASPIFPAPLSAPLPAGPVGEVSPVDTPATPAIAYGQES